ncbi:MAG TPA: hypothetical protein VFB23_11390 [Candidatus Acidoferrales bacterium]|nr:hypothetical protein [Candidatus Acidoferrales bacterium]
MTLIRQWWPVILAVLGKTAAFIMPSVNTFAAQHPTGTFAALLVLIVSALAKQAPEGLKKTIAAVKAPGAPLGIFAMCLVLTVATSGCLSASQFEQVLNEVAPAVSTILQIVAIFTGQPVNTAVPEKIKADVAGLEQLYSDYQAAQPATKTGIAADINADFGVLSQDLTTVFSIAQVNDPKTQQKITQLIGFIQDGVQLAEAAIPQSSGRVGAKPVKLTPGDLVDSFDKVLVAKTGNKPVDDFTAKHQLHLHSKFVRVVTFGRAK